MSFKDELKNSIKEGMNEALVEALRTKSIKDIKKESTFNPNGFAEKMLGGAVQTLMTTNPITLFLEKNLKLTEKLFTSAKFAGNLAKGLVGNALKNTIAKKLGLAKNDKALTKKSGDVNQLQNVKSLNIPAIQSLHVTSKNCMIKADKVLLLAGNQLLGGRGLNKIPANGARLNNFIGSVAAGQLTASVVSNAIESKKPNNLLPGPVLNNKATKLIQAKSIQTVRPNTSAVKLPDKNSAILTKSLQNINKSIISSTKIAKNILSAVRFLAAPLLLGVGILGAIALVVGAVKKLPDVMPKMGQDKRDQQAENMDSIATPSESAALDKRANTKGAAGYGKITSRRGYRTHPVSGQKGSWHGGTDYGVPLWTPVYAPFDAIVTRISQNKWNGNFIELKEAEVDWKTQKGILKKNGMRVMFLHLASVAKGLREGTTVKRGEIVAYSGNTGIGTGAHLDMRVYSPKAKLDPQGNRTLDSEQVNFGGYKGYGAFAQAMAKKGGVKREKVYMTKKPNIVQAKINDVKDALDERKAEKEYKDLLPMSQTIPRLKTSNPKVSSSEANKNELKAQNNSNRLNAARLAQQQEKAEVNKSMIAANSLRRINVPPQPQSSTNIIYGITDNIDRLAAGGESLDIA